MRLYANHKSKHVATTALPRVILCLWVQLFFLILFAGLGPAMGEVGAAPDNLGVGHKITQNITYEEITNLWGRPTRKIDVEGLQDLPGRTILHYRFPDKRLLGLFYDGVFTKLTRKNAFGSVEFHFNFDGSLIFMAETISQDGGVASGEELRSFNILPGKGHIFTK